MHEHEARLERLEAERVEAPRAARRLKLGDDGRSPVPGRHARARSSSGPRTSSSATCPRRRRESAAPRAEQPPREPVVVARIPFLAAQRGERIGIVGPNGAGKTTLLRTIAGELPPLDGILTIGGGVSIGYLAQLRGAAIPGATVLDALLEAIPITAGEARGYLARFLFRGDDAFKEVRTLSGGERSRLELALLGIMPSNLLLLDEPTNHLDIPAREAIETFMRETPATLLVVSHDRRLLETVCDRLWVVDGGRAAPFDGGYRAWRAAVAEGWTVEGAIDRRGPPATDRRSPGRRHGRRGCGRDRRIPAAGSTNGRSPGDASAGAAPADGTVRRPIGASGRPRPEAVEGSLPAPEDRARGRAHPARAAQEPPRAGDGRPGRRGELRRAAPDLERAGRRLDCAGDGRGVVARARGAGTVTPTDR